MSEYIDFYLGKKNKDGISIDDVLKYDYFQLESEHHYIQFCFILMEPSEYHRGLPLLSIQDIRKFKEDKEVKKKMIRMFLKMLDFYGLKCVIEENGMSITKAENYDNRKGEWQTGQNHNFLRITRILTSLKLFGFNKLSNAFYDCLIELFHENPEGFNAISIDYWTKAIEE